MVRFVKVWNNLPADVVICANCVFVFVHKLKSVDVSQFQQVKTNCHMSCINLTFSRPRVVNSNPSSALVAGTLLVFGYCCVFTHCIALSCFNY